MKCPYCGNLDDRVLDTRDSRDGCSIRRRRECLKCKGRFSTAENLQVSYPLIVKKDGRREPFQKEKILKGLQAACQKRPIALDHLEGIVERLSNWVLGLNEKEISSRAIGLRIIAELRQVDDVAYVRFASVYRSFKDIQEFVETLEEAVDNKPCEPRNDQPNSSQKTKVKTVGSQLAFFSEGDPDAPSVLPLTEKLQSDKPTI